MSKYTMPYIEDKNIYMAVCFALKLKEQMPYGKAIWKAAGYYDVRINDVAYYLGKTGANKRARNSENNDSYHKERQV
jgi:hypothetical protein